MKRLILALAALFISGAESLSFPLSRVSRYTSYTSPSLSSCGPTQGVGQIALSKDLFRKVGGCGVRVRVCLKSGACGTYLVFDRTHARYRNTADIYVSSRAQAMRLGLSTGTLEVLR